MPVPETITIDDLRETLTTYRSLIFVDYSAIAASDARPEWGDVPEADTDEPEPEAPALDMTPILRPNGEAYHPRVMAMPGKAGSSTDVDFIRKVYESRMPALLFGLPGTGKSSLLEAALPGLITVMGNSDTEVADFIGSWIQNPDGTYEWVDGPLVLAMEGGVPLLIDEIALVDPRTMALVYSVMDGRNRLPITANPRRGDAVAVDGFVVYGACNPDAPGSIMSDALLSRFQIHVNMTTDWDLAGRLGVPKATIEIARKLEDRYTSGDIVAPPQLREMLTFRDVSEVFGVDVAYANLLSQARLEDRAVYSEVMQSKAGSTKELSI